MNIVYDCKHRIGATVMAKRQFVLERPHHFRNAVLAILGGVLAFIFISEMFRGTAPFLGFIIAAIVIYFITRR